tara:strand:+ start:261 stop:914 length:654 start_codon:yes stop_codon:yes gene_type:complete
MTTALMSFFEGETDTSIDFSSDDHSIDFCDDRNHYKEIRKILFPLKQQVLNKIEKNKSADKKDLNIFKAVVPEILIWGTFERTFSTGLGLKLQEIAAVCGTNVVNIDKKEGKKIGVDLRAAIGLGQLKAGTTTQTGTHKGDSLNKLLETSKKENAEPFFATALGESYEYLDDNGVLYIGGKSFWKKIGVDYDTVYNTIVEVIVETYEEVKLVNIPTV